MNRVMGGIILILKMVSLNDRFNNKKKDNRPLIQVSHSVHLILTHKESIGAVFFPSSLLQRAVSILLWFPKIIWCMWEEDNGTSAYVSLYLETTMNWL